MIQYIYPRYGRERAGLAAAVITYRTRSAIRETAKVFGLSDDVVAALNGTAWGQETTPIGEERVRAVGLDPADPTLKLALEMAKAADRLSAPSDPAQRRLRHHQRPAR